MNQENHQNSKAEKTLWKTFYLFNPSKLLISIRPILSAGMYLVYPLPFFLFAAFIILWQQTPAVGQELSLLLKNINIIIGLSFNVITVGALAAFTSATVAYSFGATVNSISMTLIYHFIPRFVIKLEDIEKFNRREKLWYRASPMITQLWMFSLGILLWYNGRHLGGVISLFGTTLAFISGISFLISSCPFNKSTGYYFLAEFLNEPNIRNKAFLTLLNKWKKDVYVQTDSNVLLIYALACVCFTIILFVAFFFSLYIFLDVEFGSKSLVVLGILILGICLKLRELLKKINEDYIKRQQLERWRERVLPEDKPESKAPSPPFSFGQKIVIAFIVLFLLAPYPYRPSGKVVLMPIVQQQISTDIAGIVDEVNFEGGEFLEEGTVVARLSVSDSRAQLKIQKANLAQQQAVVTDLKSRPTKEEIEVVRNNLETSKIRSEYSENKCERQRKLYDTNSISLDAMETVEKECSVDKQQVIEAESRLAEVVSGIPPEQIAAAEAALEPIMAQINLFQDKISRSEFKMPFTGKLATLHLKEKKGKFFDTGVPLAEAKDDSSFQVVLEIPEEDASRIKTGAEAEIRLAAYPNNSFKGIVKTIDPDVKNQSYGKMIQIIITLKNKKNNLKAGMSGYAKVRGNSLMGWQMLTRPIFRFLTVEVWAWLP